MPSPGSIPSSCARSRAVGTLEEVHFNHDDAIVSEGDIGDAVYLITDGTRIVKQNGAKLQEWAGATSLARSASSTDSHGLRPSPRPLAWRRCESIASTSTT